LNVTFAQKIEEKFTATIRFQQTFVPRGGSVPPNTSCVTRIQHFQAWMKFIISLLFCVRFLCPHQSAVNPYNWNNLPEDLRDPEWAFLGASLILSASLIVHRKTYMLDVNVDRE